MQTGGVRDGPVDVSISGRPTLHPEPQTVSNMDDWVDKAGTKLLLNVTYDWRRIEDNFSPKLNVLCNFLSFTCLFSIVTLLQHQNMIYEPIKFLFTILFYKKHFHSFLIAFCLLVD